jgi:hypothetical protein
MPKHIIISRKGFDTSNSDWPSPIIDYKTILSFPIPNPNEFKPKIPIPYSELYYKDKSYATILSELTDGKFDRKTCHLDPDINKGIYPRDPGWKAIFGPLKGAYTHLNENGVKKGDLILFFGWFKHIEEKNGKYSYIKDKNFRKGMHVIFGYMEIGEDLHVKNTISKTHPWALYHPHISEVDRQDEHIFIAAKYGVFPFSEKLILTQSRQSLSRWNLPFLKTIDMSWNPHKEKRWNEKEKYFQTVGRGQEFVLDAKPEVIKWVHALF